MFPFTSYKQRKITMIKEHNLKDYEKLFIVYHSKTWSKQ